VLLLLEVLVFFNKYDIINYNYIFVLIFKVKNGEIFSEISKLAVDYYTEMYFERGVYTYGSTVVFERFSDH
jgi:hypothetical protein